MFPILPVYTISKQTFDFEQNKENQLKKVPW